MGDPVFKLAGIVKSKNAPEDFEGPLTLILQLLSKNKIEIQDISISLILEQYLEYLGAMAEMDLDIASEFVAMASHLTYIKTKMLLTGGEEVSELENLISSLEELRGRDTYVRIKTVTAELEGMYFNGAGLMVKQPEILPADGQRVYSHESGELRIAIARIIERGTLKKEALNKKPVVFPMRIAYPVDEKISELTDMLRSRGVTRIIVLLSSCKSRSETVATFVAILELCKLGRLLLAGEGAEMTANLTSESSHLQLSREGGGYGNQ
jgi:segregation and condensation protein A